MDDRKTILKLRKAQVTRLTFDQKVTAAHAYHIIGIPQHHVATIFNVNQGRIAEACAAVERALEGLEQDELRPHDEPQAVFVHQGETQ